MFGFEHIYARARAKKTIAGARADLQLTDEDSQIGRPTDQTYDDGEKVAIFGRSAYAQNEAYLELVSPASESHWGWVYLLLLISFGMVALLWVWYGLGVHPLLFNEARLFLFETFSVGKSDLIYFLLFGWLFILPFGLLFVYMLYALTVKSGFHTMFFNPLRGRIRFNRLTRKVYVLRPPSCGGNAVLEWDRMVAVLNWRPFRPRTTPPQKQFREETSCLILHHPADDPNDPSCKGEDTIYVGVSALIEEQPVYLWEYIRRYMEYGPGNNGVPEHIPHECTTFCGKRSFQQYRLETEFDFGSYCFHMLSQVTCWWPKFPPEWQSDSGIGEPEDKPVQAGAVMTALVYRAQGKLSTEDEDLLMQRYGE